LWKKERGKEEEEEEGGGFLVDMKGLRKISKPPPARPI
jgi:hypothetical protein